MKLALILTILLQACILSSQTIVKKTVKFKNDQFSISATELNTIKEIADLIKLPNFSYLQLFGYSSISGNKEHNEQLSKNRAYQVFEKIINITQIDKSKIYIEWFGESNEVDHLHYESPNYQSKCVDVLIILENMKTEANKVP